MVEGNEECVEELKKTGVKFEISLVGDTVRNVSYFRSNNRFGMIRISLHFLWFILSIQQVQEIQS